MENELLAYRVRRLRMGGGGDERDAECRERGDAE
jgi:hypothetical protein